MNLNYIFTSKRLGFRSWKDSDLDEFAKMNADQDVMEHFPKPLTRKETQDFIVRLKAHCIKHKHCYFAVEILENQEFIGFIGLAYQTYRTDFTPATDIGWRLKKEAWGNGFATEGAKRCLEYGFTTLNLKKVISTCTAQNKKSEHIMKKIGMSKLGAFNHPDLQDYPEYEKCYLYKLTKSDWERIENTDY